MKSCGKRNVRKNREIKNGDKYTTLVISLELDCLDKRELTSSESRDYMGISGKDMTTSLTLRTKSPNNKQKSSTAITDITKQYFSKFLREFKISPYIGYKQKNIHNEPTEA